MQGNEIRLPASGWLALVDLISQSSLHGGLTFFCSEEQEPERRSLWQKVFSVTEKKQRLKFNIPNSNWFLFCFSQPRDRVWLNL